jgi:hypothetical protein
MILRLKYKHYTRKKFTIERKQGRKENNRMETDSERGI